MVSGLEFLRMVFQPAQSQLEGSVLLPFTTYHANNPEVQSAPADAGITGLAPDAELQHPRPVRKVALQDALQRFEEIAQSFDCRSLAETDSLVDERDPVIVPRRTSMLRASATDMEAHSTLPLWRRVIQRPQKMSSQQRNGGTFSSLGLTAPLGPSIWAPCPEGPWPVEATSYVPRTSAKEGEPVYASSITRKEGVSPLPASVLLQFSSQGRLPNGVPLENTSCSNAMSASPSFYSWNMAEGLEPRTSLEMEDDDSELEYISNFLDDDDEMGNDALDRLAVLVGDIGERSNDEYYTASVYPEYSEHFFGVANRNEAPPRPPTILSIRSYWAYRSSSFARSSSYCSSSSSSTSSDTTPADLPSSSSPPPHLHSLKRLSHTEVVFMDAVDRACQTFAPVLR